MQKGSKKVSYKIEEMKTKQDIFNNILAKKTFLCIGLDSDLTKIPQFLLEEEDPVYTFNKAIIDATAKYCVAYKPNTAFYEANGLEGMCSLEKTIEYIRNRYPDQLIILDAKRGDIGNTSEMYAKSAFEAQKVSAITVAPYMGEDSVKPFYKYKNKWVILLALTSNKGSNDFQMQRLDNGEYLFETVLKTSKLWGTDENTMYVVGATQGELFKKVRSIVPDHFLLVPGVGAQGGNLAEVVEWGMNKQCGLLVNSSRAIIFADNTESYANTAKLKAKEMQEEMSKYLEHFYK